MERGRKIATSAARLVAMELLHHAQKVPSLPTARLLDISRLVEARRDALPRITWMAVFIRAYALVAEKNPVLRRALIPYPRPHFYEHPFTSPAVLVERELDGEPVVLAAKLRRPEGMDLATIAGHLRRFQEAAVREVSDFRQVLRLGALPWAVRRFAFWSTLYLSGATRARRFGTCMVSSLGKYGARQIHPITPLTTYFTVGPVGADGHVEARIIYDHRVTDDGPIARCLCQVEEVLNGPLLAELRGMRDRGEGARGRPAGGALRDPCASWSPAAGESA